MKNKIFLIGIPNSGKTTLGKRVAEMLNMPFYDTDEMTIDKVRVENPIKFFLMALNGSFIEMQRELIHELSQSEESAIIATGAEVALINDCALTMAKSGIIIHIKRSPADLIDEIKKGKPPRFVIRDVTHGIDYNPSEKSVELYSEELSRYEEVADVSFKNDFGENDEAEKLAILVKALSEKAIGSIGGKLPKR